MPLVLFRHGVDAPAVAVVAATDRGKARAEREETERALDHARRVAASVPRVRDASCGENSAISGWRGARRQVIARAMTEPEPFRRRERECTPGATWGSCKTYSSSPSSPPS
jgi:hypothetical protein